MHPIRFGELEHYRTLWLAQGDTLIAKEARREARPEREVTHPGGWIFGDKTEADFPLGYVRER